MKKLLVTTLALVLLSQLASGQTISENLKRLADESSQAFVKGDFGRVADLTFPKLVALMGGKEKMVAYLEKGTREMKAEGNVIFSMVPGDPTQIETIGEQVFAVLPVTLKIKVDKGTLIGKSFMIGVSNDDGKSWTFVDGSNLDERKMTVLFPTAVGKLKLPTVGPPTLVPDQKP